MESLDLGTLLPKDVLENDKKKIYVIGTPSIPKWEIDAFLLNENHKLEIVHLPEPPKRDEFEYAFKNLNRLDYSILPTFGEKSIKTDKEKLADLGIKTFKDLDNHFSQIQERKSSFSSAQRQLIINVYNDITINFRSINDRFIKFDNLY